MKRESLASCIMGVIGIGFVSEVYGFIEGLL